jgi:choice-of-anchor A domain-containing protein
MVNELNLRQNTPFLDRGTRIIYKNMNALKILTFYGCFCGFFPVLSHAQTLSPTMPMRGFSVFVKSDASLKSTALDGALAVGENVSFDKKVQLCKGGTSQFFLGEENAPLGLFVGGELLFKYAADVQMGNESAVKILNIGSNQIVSKPLAPTNIRSGESPQAPKMQLLRAQTSQSISSRVNLPATEIFQKLSRNAQDLALLKPNAPVKIEGENATISILPNEVNVWNIRIEDLAALKSLHFEQCPSVISPLVINVYGFSSEFSWKTPVVNGLTASSSLFMLYNFLDLPYLNINVANPLYGTLFAPNTSLTLFGKAKVEGQIAAEALFLVNTPIGDRPFSALLPEFFAQSTLAESTQARNAEPTQINIFPNPVIDLLNIQSTEKTLHTALIYNVLGQLVQAVQLSGASLSVRELPLGVYYLHLLSKEGRQLATLTFQKGE